MATERRLIDANALLCEYCQANGCNEVIDEVCPNCFTAGLIANAPTVDAVEVVYGRWVQCKDWDYDYECSICEGYAGEDTDGNYNKLTPYCPNCGAKMDGDGNA